MKDFTSKARWNAAAALTGSEVSELPGTDLEDPLRHYVAQRDTDITGYYCEGHGFIAESEQDIDAIRDDRSEYFLYI